MADQRGFFDLDEQYRALSAAGDGAKGRRPPYDSVLNARGYLAVGGQIVDATTVEARRPRLAAGEKTTIKGGGVPESWSKAKRAQMDRNGRWTLKRGRKKQAPDGSARTATEIVVPAFGYKNHIGLDRRFGLIRTFAVNHAAAYDGGQLKGLLDPNNLASAVWADTAYRSGRQPRPARSPRPGGAVPAGQAQRPADAGQYRPRQRQPRLDLRPSRAPLRRAEAPSRPDHPIRRPRPLPGQLQRCKRLSKSQRSFAAFNTLLSVSLATFLTLINSHLEASATETITTLHTIPVDPSEIPQVIALGFNLVIIEKWDDANGVTILNGLPAGARGLVQNPRYCSGATQEFKDWALRYANNPKLYGFYMWDEPDRLCSAANLKSQSDWVRANMPGVKTVVVLQERADPAEFTAYADGQDFLGLNPYPCWPAHPDYCDYGYITKVVNDALAAGVPAKKIVPVYQAFGGDGMFRMPTADEGRQILAAWAALIPNPAFDYTFTWRPYGTTGWTTLKDSPELQAVFQAHNASGNTSPSSLP